MKMKILNCLLCVVMTICLGAAAGTSYNFVKSYINKTNETSEKVFKIKGVIIAMAEQNLKHQVETVKMKKALNFLYNQNTQLRKKLKSRSI